MPRAIWGVLWLWLLCKPAIAGEEYTLRAADIHFSGPNAGWLRNKDTFRVLIKKGPNGLFQYKSDLKSQACYRSGRITADFYFPDGFVFSSGVQKLPLGFWGGGEGTCVSGGCPPDKQDGFSLRLFERGGEAYLYSYDADRRAMAGLEKTYGREIPAGRQIPKGQWVRLALETQHEQKQIGLYVNGQKAQSAEVELAKGNWCIKGPMLTHMWGGDIQDPTQWSVRDQFYLVRNYRMVLW